MKKFKAWCLRWRLKSQFGFCRSEIDGILQLLKKQLDRRAKKQKATKKQIPLK
jgi:hypothetical protein